jgi:PilZ domain
MGNEKRRRRSERFEVKIPVKVTISREGRRSTVTGEGCNFSKGGMRLFLTLALDTEAPLLLEFVLPYTSTPIVIRGVVRNQGGLHYGIESLGVSPYQQQVLERNCNVLNLLS